MDEKRKSCSHITEELSIFQCYPIRDGGKEKSYEKVIKSFIFNNKLSKIR